MTSEGLESIIKREISDIDLGTNSYGINWKECLIKPIKQKYFSFDKSEVYDLWTVFEELPDGSGFKIVYDEKEEKFGLGVLTLKNELILLWLKGDFVATFNAI